MTLQTALRLGRVSNLPTVWTNVLAGVALANGELRLSIVVPLAVALSLFYVAGMYLNDAFDREWDARHRPERPIPAGLADASTVFAAGFGMLGLGLLLLGVLGGTRALVSGAGLAGLILLYDATHKGTALAPVMMAGCRVGVYLVAATGAGQTLCLRLWAGAAVLLLYVAALTIVARREAAEPRTRDVVGRMIAGISILDALFLGVTGHWVAAVFAVGAYFLTRAWQRHVPGT